jgi:hypothetical protein
MATREQVMAALFVLLSASSTFKTSGRRLRDPESVNGGDRPALFVIEANENYDRQASNVPAKHYMHVWAIIYTDVGDDDTAIPATQINAALDALDTAMKPDNTISRQLTLGGLVQSCIIDGEVMRASGDVNGKGVTAVPIKILRVV